MFQFIVPFLSQLIDVDLDTNPPVDGDFFRYDAANQLWSPQAIDSSYTVFPIWAEESGGLSNNNRQWSFGNGATGAINIVLPIDAELFAVTFDSEVGGVGTVSIDIMKNDAVALTTKDFAVKDFETLTVNESFAAGDCIGFQTNTETGALTDARICAWFRIPRTTLSGSQLGELLDVSITSPVTGQVITWNGSNWVNLITVQSVNSLSPDSSGNVNLALDDLTDVDDSNNPKTEDGYYSKFWNNATSQYELFREFEAYATENNPLVHQTANNFFTYLTLTVDIPVAGDYRLDTSFLWSLNTTGADIRTRLINGGTTYWEHRQEAKDSAGTGITVDNTTGGTTNTSTDQRYLGQRSIVLENLAAGVQTFEFQFTASGTGLEPAIYQADMFIRRMKA